MIILEMGYIDAQGTMGITLEQWFMLSFFIIICSIIVLVLPVVGTLMSETPSAQGTRRGGGADRNRGVIIEAVPERDEDELEEVEAKARLQKLKLQQMIPPLPPKKLKKQKPNQSVRAISPEI
jgi:hypothetical protein